MSFGDCGKFFHKNLKEQNDQAQATLLKSYINHTEIQPTTQQITGSGTWS